MNKPLITHIYTADPSAHVFEGRIYLYPSHDRDTGIADNDLGDQYDMADYHVFSMSEVGGEVVDHGIALDLAGVPWAAKQLWAPDATCANGRYYLYFPARDREGLFRIGVAVSDRPHGPFVADPAPIRGSYSIDPCCFVDDDGTAYLAFGGIWGGQLQHWPNNRYDPNAREPRGHVPAIMPRIARLSDDMHAFAEPVRELVILDEDGVPLTADDHARRYFEGPWMHKHDGRYYFSYSTGNTHYIVYAVSDSPTGPFTYAGRLLEPVVGWTTHHSIVQHKGRWYLFYHDASLSGGRNHLRCVKVAEIVHRPDGSLALAGSVAANAATDSEPATVVSHQGC